MGVAISKFFKTPRKSTKAACLPSSRTSGGKRRSKNAKGPLLHEISVGGRKIPPQPSAVSYSHETFISLFCSPVIRKKNHSTISTEQTYHIQQVHDNRHNQHDWLNRLGPCTQPKRVSTHALTDIPARSGSQHAGIPKHYEQWLSQPRRAPPLASRVTVQAPKSAFAESAAEPAGCLGPEIQRQGQAPGMSPAALDAGGASEDPLRKRYLGLKKKEGGLQNGCRALDNILEDEDEE